LAASQEALSSMSDDFFYQARSSALRPSLEEQVSVFISASEQVTQLYPQVLSSHSVAFYDSQDYGGGIPTYLHVGTTKNTLFVKYRLRKFNHRVPVIRQFPSAQQNNSYIRHLIFYLPKKS
jgi:hypothetical protein